MEPGPLFILTRLLLNASLTAKIKIKLFEFCLKSTEIDSIFKSTLSPRGTIPYPSLVSKFGLFE